MSNRNGVLRGEIIDLIVTFLNSQGTPTDPTDLSVNIFPPSYNPEDGATQADAWIWGATLSSGGSGPLASPTNLVTKITDGKFKYSLSIPASAATGVAFDEWKGTLDGQTIDDTFQFVIVGGGSVGTTALYKNNRVTLYLSEDVKAVDGSSLEEIDRERYFTTTYDPLYASVTQLRLHLGPVAKDLLDDAINLAIFEASLSANSNMFLDTIENSEYFKEARKGYVICKAQLILLQALSGNGVLTNGFKKTLGDLSISKFGNDDFIRSRLNNLEECVDGWLSVLQSGGAIGPFGQEKAQYTVKGAAASDFATTGREWSPIFKGERPIANAKTYRHDMTSTRIKYRTYVPKNKRGPKW